MICGTCVHSIIRVLWDGVSENEVIHCELDNVQVSRQMRKCSREKVPVVELSEVQQIAKERGQLYEPYPEPLIPPTPLPVVKKKPGNPNWVKRGT